LVDFVILSSGQNKVMEISYEKFGSGVLAFFAFASTCSSDVRVRSEAVGEVVILTSLDDGKLKSLKASERTKL